MENKKSKLVFDPRITRAILKKNPTEPAKFCRYCGKSLDEGCGCPEFYTVVDVKKLRGSVDGSIHIFENTPGFQKVYEEVYAELKERDNITGALDEPSIEIAD